jgi:hypothetical protein
MASKINEIRARIDDFEERKRLDRADKRELEALRAQLAEFLAAPVAAPVEVVSAPVEAPAVVAEAPVAAAVPVAIETGSFAIETRRMDDRGYGIRDGAYVRFQGGMTRAQADALLARMSPADREASRIVAEAAPTTAQPVTYADGSPDGMGQYPDAR